MLSMTSSKTHTISLLELLSIACLALFWTAPSIASAQSISELQEERDAIAAEVSKLSAELTETQEKANEFSRQLEDIKSDTSPYKKNAEEATIALYKMTRKPASVFDMFLNADSLDEAIDGFEFHSAIAADCSRKISDYANTISELERELDPLRETAEGLDATVKDKQRAFSDLDGQIHQRQEELEHLVAAADNSELARLSCSLAYSRKVSNADGYPATKAYTAAWQAVLPGDIIPQGRSCDRGVMIPVMIAGFDDSFPVVCRSQSSYLKSSPRWVDLGLWNGSTEQLKPGDILVSIAGEEGGVYDHSYMYVGYDIAQEIYDDVLAGTDADLGRPGPYDVWASASYQGGSARGRALCICSDGESGSHVFRCINPQRSERFKGTWETIRNTSSNS